MLRGTVDLRGVESLDPKDVCSRCGLFQFTHLGKPSEARGADNPSILIVGEAPGPEEDKQGSFFVGPSGAKVEQILQSVGITPDEVRFENVVRCMPKKAGKIREPTDDEIQACRVFFFSELLRLSPKLILALGNTALRALFGVTGITRLRGRVYELELQTHADDHVFRVLPTFHPASILRGNAQNESALIADFTYAKEIIRGVKEEVFYSYIDSISELDLVLTDIEQRYDSGEIPCVAVDLETTGLDPWARGAKVICLSISPAVKESYCVPYEYSLGPFYKDTFALQAVRGRLQTFLQKVALVNQNIKFDLKWLRRHLGVEPTNIVFDTMLASWHHDNTTPHDLEYLGGVHAGVYAAKQEMHEALDKIAEEKGLKPGSWKNMDLVPRDILTTYACRDADVALRVSFRLRDLLEKDNLLRPYKDLALDMIVPFTDIEYEGAFVKVDVLNQARETYEEEVKDVPRMMQEFGFQHLYEEARKRMRFEKTLKSVRSKLDEYEDLTPSEQRVKKFCDHYSSPAASGTSCQTLADVLTRVLDASLTPRRKKGEPPPEKRVRSDIFNRLKALRKVFDEPVDLSLAAPEDMACLFYRVFNLPVLITTDSGAPSTDSDTVVELLKVLEGWEKQNPGWGNVLKFMKRFKELKEGQKIYSSYLTKIPDYLDENSRVHTSYNIGATATGRFSSSDPSLHTIPKFSKVKEAFISRFQDPGKEGLILAADYSQVEMRIIAIFSGDEQLQRAFREGRDVHTENAARMFKKPAEEITQHERRQTKTTSFSILYGGGAESIASDNHIPIEEATDILNNFYASFPHIKQYKEKQEAFVMQHGVSYSAFGRRRIIPEVRSGLRSDEGKARRVAVNNPIQSTASEMTAQAIVRIWWRLRQAQARTKVFGYVHDEISLDVSPDELFLAFRILREEMGDALPVLHPWINIPIQHSFEVGVSWGHLMAVEPDWDHGDAFRVEGNEDSSRRFEDQVTRWSNPYRMVNRTEKSDPNGRPVITSWYQRG